MLHVYTSTNKNIFELNVSLRFVFYLRKVSFDLMIKKTISIALLSALAVFLCLLVFLYRLKSDLGHSIQSQYNTRKDDVGTGYEFVVDDLLRRKERDHWGKVLYRPTRIVCAVPTIFPEHAQRWRRIAKTWGSLCDKLYFVIRESHPSPPSPQEIPSNAHILYVNVTRTQSDGSRNIWEKSHRMWHKLFTDHINEAEWFLKVDDDTFLMVENLRRFLQFYNPSVPHYMGHTLLHTWKWTNMVFNSGVVYAISRGALNKVGPVLGDMPNVGKGKARHCYDRSGQAEDVSIAACLREVGVLPDNTISSDGRQRFLALSIGGTRREKWRKDFWYWRNKPEDVKDGSNCCVDEVINSHPYKGGAVHDVKFQQFHDEYHSQKVLSRSMTDVKVPPPPMLFRFASNLSFPVDEWRNIANAEREQHLFKGFQKTFDLEEKVQRDGRGEHSI